MTITRKTSLVLLLVVAVIFGVFYVGVRALVLRSYGRMEEAEALRQFDRIAGAIRDQIGHLDTLCRDWSTWDSMYRFVRDRNTAFRDENLNEESLRSAGADFILVLDGDAEIVGSVSSGAPKIQDLFETFISPDFPLLHPPAAGLLFAAGVPLLVASRPVLPSTGADEPNGVCIFGRILEASELSQLQVQTRSVFSISSWPEGATPSLIEKDGVVSIDRSDVYALAILGGLRDIYGRPGFFVRLGMQRTIFQAGLDVVHIVLVAVAVTGTVVFLVIALLLRKVVLRPIRRLKEHMELIRKNGTSVEPFATKLHDEIGDLACTFDAMMEDFDDARRATYDINEILLSEIRNREQTERELSAARAAADAANRAKSEFLARMSHEIRTPMNAVLGMSHLLFETPLSQMQREYLRKIRIAARGLLELLNDLLDLSKIEAGKMTLEDVPFRIADVLEQMSGISSFLAEEKHLAFRIECSPFVPETVVGDPLRLGQVLLNLAGNAVKFTEHGGVTVSVDVEDIAPGAVVLRFAVRDTGIGIDPEKLGNLFQSFSQADGSITRRYGGTGLGLVICRKLVEMMGGSIDVESEPGSGSTFTFTVLLKTYSGPGETIFSAFLEKGPQGVPQSEHGEEQSLRRAVPLREVGETERRLASEAAALLEEDLPEAMLRIDGLRGALADAFPQDLDAALESFDTDRARELLLLLAGEGRKIGEEGAS